MTAAHKLGWLEASPTRTAMTMAWVDEVNEGLPLKAAERLSDAIAPLDAAFKYRFVPKATYARRRANDAPLSKEESERVVRLARLWALATEVWGGIEAARRFMLEPHMLLDGKTPIDVALSGELGGKLVEEVLGRLVYGSAA